MDKEKGKLFRGKPILDAGEWEGKKLRRKGFLLRGNGRGREKDAGMGELFRGEPILDEGEWEGK